jgi:hypothetical protein
MAQHFPNKDLRVSGGSIYFHLFENELTGLPRNLFVSATLNFKPLEYCGEQFDCSMTTEWIRWKKNALDWLQLDGMKANTRYGEEGIEGSFYAFEHYPAEEIEFSFRHIKENLFELEMKQIIDYPGGFSEDDEAIPRMLVQGKAVVPFEGLYLARGMSLADVSPFIDPTTFESMPVKNQFGVDYHKPLLHNE